MSDLPAIGTYWTTGCLPTDNPMHLEVYATCARCGAFVNSKDHHEDWHLLVEAGDQASLARAWAEGKTAGLEQAADHVRTGRPNIRTNPYKAGE